MSKIKLDNIKNAIDDIKNGKIIIIVVFNMQLMMKNRENEGDFIIPNANNDIVSPEIINFMARLNEIKKHGRGLICKPQN